MRLHDVFRMPPPVRVIREGEKQQLREGDHLPCLVDQYSITGNAGSKILTSLMLSEDGRALWFFDNLPRMQSILRKGCMVYQPVRTGGCFNLCDERKASRFWLSHCSLCFFPNGEPLAPDCQLSFGFLTLQQARCRLRLRVGVPSQEFYAAWDGTSKRHPYAALFAEGSEQEQIVTYTFGTDGEQHDYVVPIDRSKCGGSRVLIFVTEYSIACHVILEGRGASEVH